jgi:hypothetical protein
LKESYISKEKEDEKALIFNEMLTHLSTNQPVIVDPNANYIKTINSLEDKDRLKITRNLNRIQTLHRRYISKKLLEKIEKTNSSKRGYRYFACQAEDKNTFFVFMASKFARKERVKHLIVLCDCINNLRNIKRIIGVATDALNPPNGRSYDFIIMEDFQKEKCPQYISNCKELFPELSEIKVDYFPNGF